MLFVIWGTYNSVYEFVCATLFPFFQAIWNWVENSPDEFARLQRQPSPELSGNIIGVIEWLGMPGRNIFGLQVAKYRQINLWPNYVNNILILCFFEIFSEYAEKLFDLVDNFAESSKRKAAVWPLQIMLLILCPVRKYL